MAYLNKIMAPPITPEPDEDEDDDEKEDLRLHRIDF